MAQKDFVPTDMTAVLHSIPTDISNIACRIVPSSFNPDDAELGPFPLPLTWRWKSCATILKHFGSEIVMSQLPLFWQLSAPLQMATQEAGAAYYLGDVENMAVNAAAIQDGMDTVAISAPDTVRFLKYLLDDKSPLPTSWIHIHQPDTPLWSFPEVLNSDKYHVAQEVHIVPGLPLLFQSPTLAEEKRSRFLVSDEFEWRITESGTYISSRSGHIVSFRQLRLPFLLTVVGDESGMPVVEKRV